MARQAVAPRNLPGAVRLRLLQVHRLVQFQAAFDGYLAGRLPASYVTARARKMLECGLPPFSVPGRPKGKNSKQWR